MKTLFFTLFMLILNIDVYCQPPVANFSCSDNSICQGGGIIFNDLSFPAATSWQWTFENGTFPVSSDQNPSILYNTVGTHDVTLIVSNASGSDTLYIPDYVTIFEPPIMTVSADTNICIGDSAYLVANGANTYTWTPTENVSNPNINNPFVYPNITTEYTVVGTSINGCTNQTFVTVTADSCFAGFGDLIETNIKIYPNPMSNFVIIECDKPIGYVEFYTNIGKLVLISNDPKIYVGDLPKGIYILKVYTNGVPITNKIVKI